MPPTKKGKIKHNLHVHHDISTSKSRTSNTKENDDQETISNNLIGYIFYPFKCSTNSNNESMDLKEDLSDEYLNNRNDDINEKFQSKTKLKESDEYLLIIPYSLTKLVSYAVQYKKDVLIRKYSFIPIYQNGKPPLTALEIHKNGIDTLPTSFHVCHLECGYSNQQNTTTSDSHLTTVITGTGTNTCSESHHQETESIPNDNTKTTSVLSLSDVQEMETLQKQASFSKKRPHFRKKPIPKCFSIVAKVDAISPIIIVPGDSFAIMELYQPGTALTCVAILKGDNALQSFSACYPGDIVQLINVKGQKWHVPNSFCKHGMYLLSRRVPSYVYVITKASSIQFQSTCKLRVTEQSNFNLFHEKNVFCPSVINTPLPSTVHPLYSLDAIITNVITHHPILGKDIYQIQILKISPDVDLTQKQERFLLFLSHYPITMSLSAGLRTGACIRAMNVHVLHKTGAFNYLYSLSYAKVKYQLSNHSMTIGFALCCRSSLTLLTTASESLNDSINDKTNILDNEFNSNAMHLNAIQKEKDSHNMNLKKIYCCNFNSLQSKTFLSNRKKNISDCIWRFSIYNLFINTGIYTHFDNKERQLVFDKIVSSLSTICSNTEQDSEQDCANNFHEENTNPANQKRTVQRDPYAEFFDHAVEDILNENRSKIKGCCGIYAGTKPFIIVLNDIYEGCIAYIQHKLQRLKKDFDSMKKENDCIGSNVKRRFCFAWSGSDKLVGSALCSQLIPEYATDQPNQNDKIYTCGITEFMWDRWKRKHQLRAIRDKVCRLPLTILQTKQTYDSNSSTTTSSEPFCDHQKDNFILVSVDAIVISFFCLGEISTKSSSTMENDKHAHHNLSPSSTLDDEEWTALNSPKMGSCTLFCVDNLLFIASVHLVSSSSPIHHEITSNNVRESSSYANVNEDHKTISLLSCLERKKRVSSMNIQENNIFVTGYLLRHQFRLCKVKNHRYSGLVISICHAPIEMKKKEENTCNASAVQCVDITVSILLSSKLKFEMKSAINTFDKDTESTKRFISDEKIVVACAWWQTAEGKNDSNSLVCGGLVKSNFLQNSNEFSHVHVPLSSFSTASNGYVRGISNLSDLCVDGSSNFEMCSSSKENSIINHPNKNFQVEGGQKLILGMLEKFTQRKSWGTTLGEMCSFSSKSSGIPKITIEDLYYEMFIDLKEDTSINLTPSCVRCVVGARLLQIRFCRARVQCTNCYKFLVKKSKSEEGDDSVDNQAHENDEKTYWHLPLPIPSPTNTPTENHAKVQHMDNIIDLTSDNSFVEYLPKKKLKPSSCQVSHKTNLRCLSNCSLEFAKVKWECSGILDGYGQAKLFADHEAAIALLGRGLDVETIEKGAWYEENGIVYNRCIPPSTVLKTALERAQAISRNSDNILKGGKLKRKQSNRDAIDFLSMQQKSEYLLYRHCRESKEPSRPLQFFCRCKPLPRNKEPLRQTHVEVIENRKIGTESGSVSRGVPTFTLPELKLTLIDLCAEETYCNVGWDMLRQFELS